VKKLRAWDIPISQDVDWVQDHDRNAAIIFQDTSKAWRSIVIEHADNVTYIQETAKNSS